MSVEFMFFLFRKMALLAKYGLCSFDVWTINVYLTSVIMRLHGYWLK
jgi:hypothetical protein